MRRRKHILTTATYCVWHAAASALATRYRTPIRAVGCEKWPTGYSILRVERDLRTRPICVEKDPQKRPTSVKRVRCCASSRFTVRHMCQNKKTDKKVCCRAKWPTSYGVILLYGPTHVSKKTDKRDLHV